MNKQRLTQLVDAPKQVNAEDLPDLKALTERYPWYSGAHMLLAVGELNAGDVLAEEHLSAAAAALPDRRLLFDAANGLDHRAEPAAVELKVDQTNDVSANLPPAGDGEEQLTQYPQVEVDVVSESDPETDVLRPDHRSEPTEVKELNVIGSKVEPPLDPDDEVVEPSEAPEEPSRPRITNEQIAERLLEQQMLQEAMAASMDFTAEIQMPKEEKVVEEISAGPSLMSFSSWLLNPDPKAEEKPKADPKDLIDKFIKGSVPSEKPKAAFFSPVEMGKRSLEEESGLITETLAKIYEQQGDIAKAIDAYYRLALKIPSKSAYFAALAKKLEEEADN